MVTRWSERDGIARYAEQLIATLPGRSFLRVGIAEGPGDYHRDFHRGPRALWLLRDARRDDDVVVQWHPHYYIRGGATSRALSYLSWGLAARLRRLTVVVHEADLTTRGIEDRLQRWMWRQPARLVFHSVWHRDSHVERFGGGRRQERLVLHHGDFYVSTVDSDRDQARTQLGLPPDRTILLMIGFISASKPDKGYERVLAAAEQMSLENVELRIVGSPIRSAPDIDALMVRLREASRTLPDVFLHEGFVDDESFDLWIRAADAVLAVYREATSSGVIARAQILGTPVVMSDAGGLPEQAHARDTVVRDDSELIAAIRTVDQEARQSRRASSSR